MINRVLRIIFVLFCVAGLSYLSLPNFSFPKPPSDALQSQEPADSENVSIRRAYFTNYTRAEVLDWYRNEFKKSSFLGIPLPTYLLNYPPEDAQTIIRDQTRSTFLQEVVHPFRESVYINGFEPKDAKDTIIIDNRNWRQKITVRFVPSPTWLRIGVFIATAALTVVLYGAWDKSLTRKRE
jgi:hypothetical protein